MAEVGRPPGLAVGHQLVQVRDQRIQVVGEAADAAQACKLAASLEPNVVVMDIALPGGSGLEAMRRMLLHEPKLRVLIFSMHGETIFVSRALQGGARGYITKASAPEVLVTAVYAIAQGERYLSEDVAAQAPSADRLPATGVEALTAREFEVLHRLARGESVKDIGEKLGLSEKTVANHQSVIREKLGVKNGAQLARLAAELGLAP